MLTKIEDNKMSLSPAAVVILFLVIFVSLVISMRLARFIAKKTRLKIQKNYGWSDLQKGALWFGCMVGMIGTGIGLPIGTIYLFYFVAGLF